MSSTDSPGGDDSASLSSSSTSKSASSSSVGTNHTDPKYKNYVQAVDKALKNFEYSSEWADLISALTKLNRVITSWSGRFGGDLPRLHLVTKRLSQCLHPNLPGGVHLKTLETYELIFKSIPKDKISSVVGPDLFSFSAGLFALWTYSSEQARPALLKIYETYLLPLIKYPALEGFLVSIFSGIAGDDSTASTPTVVTVDPFSTMGRVYSLLAKISDNVGAEKFNLVLWQVMKANPKIRLAGINYILRISAITEDNELTTQTLINCLIAHELTNESILVQRATLDLLINHFPLSSLNERTKIKLIKASLQTLLRRDMSLNRRLFSWFLGQNKDYFETHCKSSLVHSCLELLSSDDLTSSEIVRLLISLLDKPEIAILDDILLSIIVYFKRVDSYQNASMFFGNLKPEFVFEQVVLSIGNNVMNCALLEYLIDQDFQCLEFEKFLPDVFVKLLSFANPKRIRHMESILYQIIRKVHLTDPLFEEFLKFYVEYVSKPNEVVPEEDYYQFMKPKVIENFWNDLKLNNSQETDALKKFSNITPITLDVTAYNGLFEEILDPLLLKEVNSVKPWLMAMVVISCRGDILTISLLIKILKLLDKSVCYEIVEETYFLELVTKYLWDSNEFEILSELICLNKLKVEKILLTFLENYQSFKKLGEFLDFVGDFSDVKLLVYKMVENLDCNYEQHPCDYLLLKQHAEEFCCKMLRDNDLRFIDVFVSNLLLESEFVSEWMKREKESLYIPGENDVDKTSIVSDVTSEYSYKSLEEEELGALKANSTPDLSSFAGLEKMSSFSRSLCDLSQINEEEIRRIPEIIIHDHFEEKRCRDHAEVQKSCNENHDGFENDNTQENKPLILDDSNIGDKDTVEEGTRCASTPLTSKDDGATSLVATAKSETKDDYKTPSPSLFPPKIATPGARIGKKLSFPHLKICKDLSEDVQNRVLYVIAKLERVLMLQPNLFISYLKSSSTNQSARISHREENSYLELLISRLLDFMCIVIPEDGSELQLRNLNIQFRATNLLRLIFDKLMDCERLEMSHTRGDKFWRSISLSPSSSSTSVVNKRQKLKRKVSNVGGHFVSDMLTRVKSQKTLLFLLRSTTIDTKNSSFICDDVDNDVELDCSVELIKINYGENYLVMYQSILLRLLRTIIQLESLLASGGYNYYTTGSKTLSTHRNYHKYLVSLAITSQPLLHEILLSALELRDLSSNVNHYNWMDLSLQILPYILHTTCPITILTITSVCRNLQALSECSGVDESYVNRSLDYLISITNAVLFRPKEKSDRADESLQSQPSSSIYGIITSFLPGSSSTSPKVECVDEVDSQSKDILSSLDLLIKTALAVRNPSTMPKLRNLLNPICNSYLDNFLNSLSALTPSEEFANLCQEVETIRMEKLTLVCTRILNKNLLIFYRDYMHRATNVEFSPGLLNSLVKECLHKSVGLVNICEIVFDLYPKFKNEAWTKSELKDLQESLFKVFDKLVAEASSQNNNLLMEANSLESGSGQVTFMGSQLSSTRGSYNVKKGVCYDESVESILACLSHHMPNLLDLLWTDDKDRDKVMPMLTHLLASLIAMIKLRHTSTPSYISILKLLKNISYYNYFRKSWKKEIFELLLLDANFFVMIKPHYYGPSTLTDNDDGVEVDNASVIQIWKVIMDNLFTQDKSSFSELLTRVSIPQTPTLNIFTSKDTEFESRALLLKRLAFVIWSSEQDQFCKHIPTIQERLAEAIKVSSSHVVPIVMRSIFLCFRVLVLRLSNLIGLWPTIIHEIIQIMVQLEKQLLNGTNLDTAQLNCTLECFKLIELLGNLPPDRLQMFQMYRWAFQPLSTDQSFLENNNFNDTFVPYLLRMAVLIDDSDVKVSNTASLNPSKLRSLTNLSEILEFLFGRCDTLTVEELSLQLDLDFIEY